MDDGSGSNSIWQRLTRVFHGRQQLDAVEQAIREAGEEGELDQQESSMLLRVLSLDDLQVQDIMTPRTDIVCVPRTAGILEVAGVILETGHSRLPIYQDNRDNIIGVVYAKDLLSYMGNGETGTRVDQSMREPYFVPETKRVLDLLQEFRTRKTHLAIILDEYGGTAGLVTIEDVLEQIVGEIEDEYDAPRREDITAQENGWLVTGRAYLEDLEEKIGLKVESDEVDTLGGYLSHLAGRVPRAGERFSLNGMNLTVQEADPKQVHLIRVEAADGDEMHIGPRE